MNIKYCLPIIKASKTDVTDLVRDNMESYSYFEVWLDYVEGADETFLGQLAESLGDKLVVTFRRQNLETPVMDQAERQKLLDLLSGSPVFVDLDITTQKTELDQAKGLRLITSYHNYQETPDTLQLEAIIGTMKAYRPAVYKLSTLCKTEEDALRLLQQLLKLKAQGLHAIASGMGEYGAVTRIFGTLWGNEMVFAPLAAEDSSAPGQLTRQQLEAIFKELGQ